MTWEELEEGLVAVAAPVHARDGSVVAAVSVSGPTTRITEADVARLGEQLATDTGAISKQLGYRPGKAKP
jgi:DNA-binding IclR family transcriptional regulator